MNSSTEIMAGLLLLQATRYWHAAVRRPVAGGSRLTDVFRRLLGLSQGAKQVAKMVVRGSQIGLEPQRLP